MKYTVIIKKLFQRDLISAKLTYFFWNGKNAFLSYLVLFYEDIGLSSTEASLIFSMRIISQFIGSIVWSFINDKLKKQIALMLTLSFASIIFTVPQPFIAKYRSKEFVLNFTAARDHGSPSRWMPYRQVLPIFFALNILGAFFEGGLSGNIDNFIVKYVVEKGSIKDYGTQRLFGALGSGLMSLLLGMIIDARIFTNISIYTPIFIFHLFLMVCFFIVFFPVLLWSTRSMAVKASRSEDIENNSIKHPGLFSILFQTEVLPFYMFITLNGFGYGVKVISLTHLRNLQASSTLMGLFLVAGYISQTLLYPFSSKITKAFRGPLSISVLSTFIYGIRFITIGFINNPWLIFPLQFLQGVNGALLWVAIVEFTYSISNPSIECKLFGILNAIYKGASRSGGIIIAGILFEKYGGNNAYFYMGIAFSGIFILNLLFTLYVKKILIPRDDNLLDEKYRINAFAIHGKDRRGGCIERPVEEIPECRIFFRKYINAQQNKCSLVTVDTFYYSALVFLLLKTRKYRQMSHFTFDCDIRRNNLASVNLQDCFEQVNLLILKAKSFSPLEEGHVNYGYN